MLPVAATIPSHPGDRATARPRLSRCRGGPVVRHAWLPCPGQVSGTIVGGRHDARRQVRRRRAGLPDEGGSRNLLHHRPLPRLSHRPGAARACDGGRPARRPGAGVEAACPTAPGDGVRSWTDERRTGITSSAQVSPLTPPPSPEPAPPAEPRPPRSAPRRTPRPAPRRGSSWTTWHTGNAGRRS